MPAPLPPPPASTPASRAPVSSGGPPLAPSPLSPPGHIVRTDRHKLTFPPLLLRPALLLLLLPAEVKGVRRAAATRGAAMLLHWRLEAAVHFRTAQAGWASWATVDIVLCALVTTPCRRAAVDNTSR